MQTTFALAALAAVAYASPQGVTADITPSTPAPAGYSTSYSGTFEIYNANVTNSKRDLESRAGTPVILTLTGGILKDAVGRIGYIASNYQFQFDNPPQTGAIYTGGFSISNSNSSLALGGSAIWYECNSGGLNNLYDRSIADYCYQITLTAVPNGSGTGSNPVTQISDGQPQATSNNGAPVTQISDGQVQATTGRAPVTQISDGQIQAPTGNPVTQISDGQVQAPTGNPVTQISDGQVQAPSATGKPVTQISDGQVQAPTQTGAPVTQISDGQVQAPTQTGNPVTQISDGQIQAPSATANATKSITPFTGEGHTVVASSLAALIMGAAALLLL